MSNAPLIRLAARADTPELRAFVLGNLPEPLLVSMASMYGNCQNLEWVRTMVEGGLLDVREELARVDSEAAMSSLCDEWSQRAIALTHFMRDVQIVPLREDPELGPVSGALTIAVLQSPSDFTALCVQAADQLLEQRDTLLQHAQFGSVAAAAVAPTAAVARWLAAACVLDQPALAQRIATACPAAVNHLFGISVLGPQVRELIYHDRHQHQPVEPSSAEEGAASDPFQVNPLFVALALSRRECMDVLWASGADTALGRVREAGKDSFVQITTLQNYFAPVSEPRGLKAALAYALSIASVSDREVVYAAATTAMSGKMHWMQPYAVAYAAAGILDMHPGESVAHAVVNGHPAVLDQFKDRMPWDDMPPFNGGASAFLMAANADEADGGELHDERSEAMVRLARLAIEQDQPHVLQTFLDAQSGATVLEPVTTLARTGFVEPILQFIDAGFDPRAKAGDEPSFLEQVEAIAPTVAQTLRSYLAAAKARDTVDTIKPTRKPSSH